MAQSSLCLYESTRDVSRETSLLSVLMGVEKKKMAGENRQEEIGEQVADLRERKKE